MSQTSRRTFLKAAGLTSALFGSTAEHLTGAETRDAAQNGGRARKVIFMVSDGMNHGALSLAQHWAGTQLGRPTEWMKLYQEQPVVRGLVETFSANSWVTDSAAAASAWGGGRRVDNGRLNVDADKNPITPLQTKLKAQNVPLGLVTTATITHATPAGFAVSVDERGKEEAIAEQYLERGVPVLLGGGREFFKDALREKYAAAGYEQFATRGELAAASPTSTTPVLGTFAKSHLPFSIDTTSDAELAARTPTLADMAKFAVRKLEAMSPGGWFLMVEGARIDHAGHANDAAASIHDQLAFDETIGAMRRFVEKNPDTLLVITTDHGCGGIQLNGVSVSKDQGFGPGLYNGTNAYFSRLSGYRKSFEMMKREAGGLSGPPLAEYLAAQTGVTLNEEQTKLAQGLKTDALGTLFAKNHGVNWTSGNHTGDLVEFCALGAGSRLFQPFMRNLDVHGLLLRAMGV